jgi:hypothetical protein
VWLTAVVAACGSSLEPDDGTALDAAADGATAGSQDAASGRGPGDGSSGPLVDASDAAPPGTPEDASGAAGDATPALDAAGDDPAGDGAAGDGASAPPGPEAGAPPDAGGCALETISVPGAGGGAAFATALQKDATYLLKAVGSVSAGNQRVDAEFAFAPGGAASDVAGGVDVGIDVGLLWPNRPSRFTQAAPGPNRMKWNAAPQVDAMNNVTPGALFRTDSAYYMIVVGSGRPLSLRLDLPPMTPAAAGSISVSLYALSPAPPAMYAVAHATTPVPPPPPKTCGAALDTIDISVAMPTAVPGRYATDAAKLYLLQASGTGPTGAAGLGDGDAEYMDFGASDDPTAPYPLFNGYNDGEACADFGIGVDELTVGHCKVNATCNHRKNWWGTVGIAADANTMYTSPTYRNDHVYYMLYPGTGKPISFVYFDSGYGDNKPFDVMVRVFPVP